ncbi:hypothetical protein ACDY96_12750 [Rhizobium mongolense]|uniref:hypothetical protein n=1 Tax=Rhizobium mongolense TaxID=57676 RepID=UPI00355615B0
MFLLSAENPEQTIPATACLRVGQCRFWPTTNGQYESCVYAIILWLRMSRKTVLREGFSNGSETIDDMATFDVCPQQMGPAEKRAIVAAAAAFIRDVLKPRFLPEIRSSE